MKTLKAILGLSALLFLPAASSRLLASDANPGVLRFDEPQLTVPASATTAVVQVERSQGHAGTVTVAYSATAGTATAGVDFTPTSGTLTWAGDDESPKTFTVTLLLSANRTGKTVILALSNPTGGATILDTRGQETLILSDGGNGNGGDDGGHHGAAGEIGFDEQDYVGLPAAGKAVITVERSSGSNGAVSIDYATTAGGTAVAGTDFTPASGTLTWAAGDESLKTFFVPLLANGAGTVKLVLTNPTGGATLSTVRNMALLSIGGPGHDDHGHDPGPGNGPGTIKLDEDSFQVIAGNTATITVERSGGHAGTASVHYATSDGSGVAGTDYDAASGTLTWGPDEEGPKTFQVTTHANPNGSGKTFRLTLSDPTVATLGDPTTATLFLLDKNGDTSPCTDDDTTLCAASGRFRVRVTWRTGAGQTGAGHAARLNANSGTFWFFAPDNTEMLIKVLDACTPFNAYWVFYAATTDVSFTVEVTDTRSGLVKRYSNPYGQAALTITDTGTFATCH